MAEECWLCEGKGEYFDEGIFACPECNIEKTKGYKAAEARIAELEADNAALCRAKNIAETDLIAMREGRDSYREERNAVRAENVRLREALEAAGDFIDSYLKRCASREVAIKARALIRKAKGEPK